MENIEKKEPDLTPDQLKPVQNVISKRNNHLRLWGLFLIVLATILLASTPATIKEIIASVSPATQIAVRFTIAALILTPFARNWNLTLIRDGTILGLLLFASYGAETIGLETISANQASFIIGLNVVFVTLFQLLFRQSLSLISAIAAILAFTGVGVMSWEGGSSEIGLMWMLACTVCNSAYIIVMESIASRHPPLQISTVQIWVVGVLALLWSAPQLSEQIEPIKANLGTLLYLSVIATAFLHWIEVIGQRWISAHEVAIIETVEPVFGAIFAFLLLGETFQIRGFVGAALVLGGIILIVTRATNQENDLELSASQESASLEASSETSKVLVEVLNTEGATENLTS